MVRNEGDEAEDIDDLGHKAGQGLEADERSAYNGTHFMDCTAVAGGQIIGVRRVFVQHSFILRAEAKPTQASLDKNEAGAGLPYVQISQAT